MPKRLSYVGISFVATVIQRELPDSLGRGLVLRLAVRFVPWGCLSIKGSNVFENKGESQLLPKVRETGTIILIPVPSTATVLPLAASAP